MKRQVVVVRHFIGHRNLPCGTSTEHRGNIGFWQDAADDFERQLIGWNVDCEG